MLLADDKLYVSNLEGDTFVLRAGRKFELLATNRVGESTYAALAAARTSFSCAPTSTSTASVNKDSGRGVTAMMS